MSLVNWVFDDDNVLLQINYMNDILIVDLICTLNIVPQSDADRMKKMMDDLRKHNKITNKN